ncbi:MAG: ribosome small subunit-dependent GTPase A [Leptospiraceae bacterium]|nr:ribosome small subunit-dependent GTPase A [Leptospiraceae bacterium]
MKNTDSHLLELGWNELLARNLEALLAEEFPSNPIIVNLANPPLVPENLSAVADEERQSESIERLRLSRVTFVSHDRLRVHDGRTEWPARIVNQKSRIPCVGDWVLCGETGPADPLSLKSIVPQLNAISRKVPGRQTQEQRIAANVDAAFLVMGLDQNYNPARMERLIAAVRRQNVRPLIVLNKADLSPELLEQRTTEMQTLMTGEVFAISALQGRGIQNLRDIVRANQWSVICLGSSGVGKSTLINALLEKQTMLTGANRTADSRGRHTTTERRLFPVPGGGTIMDMPGLREWQIWVEDTVTEATDSAFPDIEALAQSCHFRDCRHEQEPGCAVQSAITEERLHARRLRSYHKLQREEALLLNRMREASGESGHVRSERKRNQKQLQKKYRRIAQDKRRRQGRE